MSVDYRRNPPWRPTPIRSLPFSLKIPAWQSEGGTITLSLGNPVGFTLETMEAITLDWHATTILSVRRNGRVAVGGDGQVTLGSTVMKADAVKVRKLLDGQVLVGFAGSAADGFALLERFETKLRDHPGNLLRAATELAKLWRTDRLLRRLEAMLVAADKKHSLLLSGSGDVIQPTDGILCAGSGGGYALAAARALIAHTDMTAGEIVRNSLTIAGGIDIYTNGNLTVEELAEAV